MLTIPQNAALEIEYNPRDGYILLTQTNHVGDVDVIAIHRKLLDMLIDALCDVAESVPLVAGNVTSAVT